MAGVERRDDVVLEHPNREKASSKATRATVILLLLVSIGLMLIVAVGGWNTLEGAKPILIGWCLIYFVLAYYSGRWNRGVLPLAAALAIILLIFAAIAGPEWFVRDKTGFTNPPLNENILGLVTLLLVPVQFLLIVFSMRGFTQDWHVEVERPSKDDYGYDPGPEPGPAPA
jgi:hypothetical protein